MSSKNEFVENYIAEIKAILPQISATGSRALSGKAPFKDIVSSLGEGTPNKRAPDRDGIADVIFKYIGHIPANPSRELNTRLLNDSYVFTASSPTKFDNDIVVNRDTKSAESFVDELANAALVERDRAIATILNNPTPTIKQVAIDSKSRERFFVLRGARGIGKTFFLNYLLSKYSLRLNEQRVIWVRINLPTSREFDERLDHWVDAQTTKILVRYYDHESKFCRIPKTQRISLLEHLTQWAMTYVDADSRSEKKAAVDRIRDVFAQDGIDKDISPEIVPVEICTEVRRYALEQHLGFIIVFDGFDRLDYDAKNQKRFNKLAQGLERLATGSANSNAVYLCVSRTLTFKYLWSTSPFFRFRKNTVYVVSASPLEQILRQRVGAIRKWASEREASGDPDAHGLLKLLLDFADYVEGLDNECKLEEIDRILGLNVRGKTQIIQFLFLEFLSEKNERERYRYRLVEYLTTAGRELPPIIYDHTIKEDGIESLIVETTDYDTRLLPIVFRTILPLDAEGNRVSKGFLLPGSILHATRILQILAFDERFMKRESRATPVSASEIADICLRWFDFHPMITRTLIQELETYELCIVKRQFYIEEIGDHSGVQLAPKGGIFLDSMIYDVAYLNLAAMRVLFSADVDPRDFVTLCPRPTGHTESDRRKGIARWIRSKIRNSIMMLGLIKHANDIHATMLGSYHPDPDKETIEGDFWNAGAGNWMVSQINGWTDRVLREVGNIVVSSISKRFLSEEEAKAVLKMMQQRLEKIRDSRAQPSAG